MGAPREKYRAYDLIAIHAGNLAGLRMPDAVAAAAMTADEIQALVAQVADDEAARKIRDELYAEFDRRLADPGYGLDQLVEWFANAYAPVGRSSLYRARCAIRAHESRIAETSDYAKAYVALAAEQGGEAVFAGASQRAGQLVFQLLMETRAEDLDAADPAKLAKIIGALAKIQKSRAETDMIRQRLTEARRKFDSEVSDRAAHNADGKLSAGDIDAIRKAVFGEAA